MKIFTCSYHYEGATWGFEIQAESHEDAERRFYAIRRNGQVDGEVMLTIPVPSWSERLFAWWHQRRTG